MEFNIDDLDKGTTFFYIDGDGLDHNISKEEAILKVFEKQFTVKVEGMEHLVDNSKTVHMFISPKESKSFKSHTDLVNLKILCIEGTKMFEVDGQMNTLNQDQFVLVPKDTLHRAINTHASVILSIELL